MTVIVIVIVIVIIVIVMIVIVILIIARIVMILQFTSKNHNDTKIIDRPDLARKFVPLLGEENSIQVCYDSKSPIYLMFSLL